MPGAGKSTVGVVLAKQLGMQFIDTDILIQVQEQATLEQILLQQGYLALRAIEGQIIQHLNVRNSVIATGGSAVYSHEAMENLQGLGKIIYLNVSPEQLSERLGDFAQRGIATASSTSLEQLLEERIPLYKKYAQHTVNSELCTLEEVAEKIARI
ncbi:MAG: shikimate kinase [Candidatus Azotimanducaceae bacterium]|jgi:shikimate kinase|tara:strand:- start:34 stop:498 length:465 start_codon:yes stop_codon:yes gene_type:complete